ncbi:MAG: hypothetical protein MJB14_19775 [Spirochaetes bacterium]|nr:hypothetical protein [Spirochaetota bacterium]
MAKVTEDQRQKYQEKVKYYKSIIEELTLKNKKLKSAIMKDPDDLPLLRIQLVDNYLNQITIYCGMNEVSVDLLTVKNTAFIEKARQLLYEVIIQIEKIVSNYLDVPFSDYQEGLAELNSLTDYKKLTLVKKIGFCIDLVKESFGENTKWKWSFIEIEGRYAVITKNLFDLKKFQKMDDPRQEGFKERRTHMQIAQRLLQESSDGYREKFELSTKDIEDFKKAIDYQKSLYRLNTITGETEKVEKCKKQIEVWTTLLDKHLAEIEKNKRPK